MIWQIQGTSHFIVGSIHILPSDCAGKPPALMELARRSSEIVFEHDLSDPAITEVGKDESLAHFEIPGCREIYESTSGLCDPVFLRPYKPWAAALALPSIALHKLGVEAQFGIEKQILKICQSHPIRADYLETAKELDVWGDLYDQNISLQFIKDRLADNGAFVTEFKEMAVAWGRSSLSDLETITDRKLKLYPGLFKPLVYIRNEAWLPRIIKKINSASAPILFVVGAFHCIGNGSIIDLLKEGGFECRFVGWNV